MNEVNYQIKDIVVTKDYFDTTFPKWKDGHIHSCPPGQTCSSCPFTGSHEIAASAEKLITITVGSGCLKAKSRKLITDYAMNSFNISRREVAKLLLPEEVFNKLVWTYD